MREQQSPNVGSVIGDSLSFCHLCCIGRGFPWSHGQLPGGSGPCRPLRHRQESHLLFSARTGLLPTPMPSHLPMLHCQGQPLRFRPETKSVWVFNRNKAPLLLSTFLSAPSLPFSEVYYLIVPLIMNLPPLLSHAAGTKAICNFPPPKHLPPFPWKMPALAGVALLALLRHQHSSEAKKALGSIFSHKEKSNLLYTLLQAVQ